MQGLLALQGVPHVFAPAAACVSQAGISPGSFQAAQILRHRTATHHMSCRLAARQGHARQMMCV